MKTGEGRAVYTAYLSRPSVREATHMSLLANMLGSAHGG
jgi:hypothetical protein